MKLALVKTPEGLKPADEQAEKAYSKWANGEIIQADYKPFRNYKFHNKFFSMVRTVFENQDKYKLEEEILDIIKLKAGHYRLLVTPKGKSMYIPKSISFESMDELEFGEFYQKAVQSVIDSGLADEQTMNYIMMNY